MKSLPLGVTSELFKIDIDSALKHVFIAGYDVKYGGINLICNPSYYFKVRKSLYGATIKIESDRITFYDIFNASNGTLYKRCKLVDKLKYDSAQSIYIRNVFVKNINTVKKPLV